MNGDRKGPQTDCRQIGRYNGPWPVTDDIQLSAAGEGEGAGDADEDDLPLCTTLGDKADPGENCLA